MVMPALDDTVRDIVMPAVVAARDDVVMTAVTVYVDMLVLVTMPARTVFVILGRGGGGNQDSRCRDQGCKARLHCSNLLGCSDTKTRSAPLNEA